MRRFAPVFALTLLGACRGVPLEGSALHTLDPVVIVHGAGGDELGVSTDYGVLFLGRTAQSGRVEFTAWFGDGPAREEGVIEAFGGGVYATEAEILLPSVQLCFAPPPAGTEVVVRGRKQGVPFEIASVLDSDPRLTGVLLEPSDELDALDDSVLGAGVFLVQPGKALQLVGLLSGRLQLSDGKRFFTALGPEDFWRLVVHRRNTDRPRRAVYREDIL
ncbi:MAG: hypothetical protein EXS08_00810 [Planctomycetes bacterium]|nr:hypothetical protein [Planctomycetota bacterium]